MCLQMPPRYLHGFSDLLGANPSSQTFSLFNSNAGHLRHPNHISSLAPSCERSTFPDNLGVSMKLICPINAGDHFQERDNSNGASNLSYVVALCCKHVDVEFP